MANPKNRAQVEEELKEELERDRTKTYVVEISPLGLVEMTRQNVTDGPREILTKRCPTCAGDGIVVSEMSTAVDAERSLRALAAQSPRTKAFKVELNAHVASILIGPGAERLKEIEAVTKRVFLLEGKEGVPLDHFAVLDKGTVEKLAPKSPYAEGKELEVKLGEVGLHDPEAGMGKLDGYEVCVGEAARLVGKKVKARVERVIEGTIYASLVGGAVVQTPAPITAEGLAEKPTRAGARKGAESAVAPEPESPEAQSPEAQSPEAELEEDKADDEAPADEEAVAEEEAATDAEGAPDADAAQQAPRKRTRRGSRGGRRHRKPAGAATAATANGAVAAEDVETAGPRIHLPDPTLGAEPGEAESDNGAQPARKRRSRSRRGTGQGQSQGQAQAQSRPAAAAVAEETQAVTVEPEAEASPDGAPKRKRTRRGSRGGRRHRKPAATPAGTESAPES